MAILKCYKCDWGLTLNNSIGRKAIEEEIKQHLKECGKGSQIMAHNIPTEKDEIIEEWELFKSSYSNGFGHYPLSIAIPKTARKIKRGHKNELNS